MNFKLTAAAGACLLALSACGGNGDDALGENVQEAYENKADVLEGAADNASGAAADSLEAQADVLEAKGDAAEEAIDDSDVNAHAMSDADKQALTNGL